MNFSSLNISSTSGQDSDHIWYDIDITNASPDTAEFPNLVFNDIRSTPILKNCQDYYMSITRFFIQTPTLPAMVCKASKLPNELINQGTGTLLGLQNCNVLDYEISIGIGADPNNLDIYSQNVMFVPENGAQPPTYPYTLAQQYASNYYYLNTQSSFIKMVNNCFQSLMQEINLNYQFLNATATQATNNIPTTFMEFDPSGTTLLNVPFCFADNIVSQITSLVVNTKIQANYVLVTTDIPHQFNVGNKFVVSGSSIAQTNGQFVVNSVLSPTSFSYLCTGFPVNTGVFTNFNNLTTTLKMYQDVSVTISVAGQIDLVSSWNQPNIKAGMFMTIQNASNPAFNGTFYCSASTGSTFSLLGNPSALPIGATSGSPFSFGYTYFYLYFNNSLFMLFNSYASENNGQTLSSGLNYRIKTPFTGTNILDQPASFSPIPSTTAVPVVYFLQILPDYGVNGMFCPISNLTFQSGLIPIQPSLTSAPNLFGSNDNLLNSGNNSNVSSVITDFQVSMTNGNDYRTGGSVSYVPSGEYRLYDLYQCTGFSSVQISVFWKDFFSNLHAFTLGANCSANIKVMFRRKSYGKTFVD